jgi:multiple sugar transport system substrate-binding protein
LANQKLASEVPYLDVLRKQLVMGNPDWRPMIPQWDTINVDYMGKAIPKVLNNLATSQNALNDCALSVNDLMRQWGYQT